MGDYKEMPLWQQHLIQKQIQEIQRKNQIQQLEGGIRQQNMLCQVASPRQRAQHQLPPIFNGLPINNQSSFMLHNDVVHAEPNAANSSNMFMMSNNHSQAKHLFPTGFIPQQQFDQLLHGTPVSSSRGLMSHYTQLQGMARNYTDAIDKASVHSLAHQNIQAQDFQNLDGQTSWSNNLEQNGVGPSQALIGLDPEEEKILFGKNDGGSLGVFLNDDSFKSTDSFDAFPSLNSGSWSALMQDAVQSSSSDKGFQEEWSGLSFQNPESSITKYQVTLDNNSNNSNDTSVRSLPVSDELSVRQMFNGITQEQIQPNDVTYGVWPRNMHDQSNKSNQGNWNDQESISLSISCDRPDGNINGGNISGAMNQLQFNQTQSIPIYGNNSNSSEEIDQRALDRYHYDHGMVAFDSSTKPRCENVEEFKHQRNNIHQIQELSMNSIEQSPSMSDSRTSSGMSGWKPAGPEIFQLPKDTDNSTTFPRSIFQKSQEQGYVANSQLKKGHVNSLEEVQHRSSMSRHPSQNMHELLPRVDKANVSVPPSQIQPVSNHDLQSHASFLYSNSQQLDSIGFDHSLHHPNVASQKEHLELKPFSSGQKHDDVSQIISEGNSSANSASNLSYMGRQSQMWKHQQLLQQQQLLHLQRLSNASKHDSHASQSLLRRAQNFQNMAIANQSSHTPSPNVAGRILPFNLGPPFHLTSIHNLKTIQTQQMNSPDVLHNVWANTSSRGSNELGTCSQNSPNFVEGDKIPADETSMNGFDSETCSALQDQEKTPNDYSNINSIKHFNLPSVGQQPNFSLQKEMQANKVFNAPSSDTKMFSLSSGENEEKFLVKTVHDIQIQSQHPSSTSKFVGKSEQSLLTPQMTRSMFEQSRKCKNGQFVAISQNVVVNSNAANGSSDSSPQLQLSVNSDIFERSKKHKIERTELESWHRVVSLGVQSLQNISMAEYGWAQATNRLIDKMEDAIELIEDGLLVPRARRRLTLTTFLMQKLLPPIPAPILAAKATFAYESVIYFIAKQALGDACSLISCSQSDCGEDKENKVTEKHINSKKTNDVLFSNVVEEVSGKLEKFENTFSRLDKRTSLLETRLDWQEVERISLINRLGKIHSRNQQAEVADSASTSHNVPRREIQRFVTGFSTAYVPHGVQCLSL